MTLGRQHYPGRLEFAVLYIFVTVLPVDIYIDTLPGFCMKYATLNGLLALNGRKGYCLENVRGAQYLRMTECPTYIRKPSDPFLTLVGFSGTFSGMLYYCDGFNRIIHFP